MRTIGAHQAKAHLSHLLDEVERGAVVTITKHGRPVARLVPADSTHGGEDLAAEFARARSGLTLGMSVTEAVAQGRR